MQRDPFDTACRKAGQDRAAVAGADLPWLDVNSRKVTLSTGRGRIRGRCGRGRPTVPDPGIPGNGRNRTGSDGLLGKSRNNPIQSCVIGPAGAGGSRPSGQDGFQKELPHRSKPPGVVLRSDSHRPSSFPNISYPRGRGSLVLLARRPPGSGRRSFFCRSTPGTVPRVGIRARGGRARPRGRRSSGNGSTRRCHPSG